MTYSIVARDPDSGAFAVAVATCNLAVGALVPFAKAGVGAVASQARSNPLFGGWALDLLEQGADAETVVAEVTARDDSRDHRQLHVIDAQGRSAVFTGAQCVAWAGAESHDGFSVAGNMLSGPEVLPAMVAAYRGSNGEAQPLRLMAVLRAGEAAGGDKRGRQSAAMRIVTDQPYPWLDLRVDDDVDPVARLQHLLDLFDSPEMARQRAFRPTLANPHSILPP
ncbi:MAG: DUF1028 domain-containing protein [Alphaproteobacteria bacterium]